MLHYKNKTSELTEKLNDYTISKTQTKKRLLKYVTLPLLATYLAASLGCASMPKKEENKVQGYKDIQSEQVNSQEAKINNKEEEGYMKLLKSKDPGTQAIGFIWGMIDETFEGIIEKTKRTDKKEP